MAKLRCATLKLLTTKCPPAALPMSTALHVHVWQLNVRQQPYRCRLLFMFNVEIPSVNYGDKTWRQTDRRHLVCTHKLTSCTVRTKRIILSLLLHVNCDWTHDICQTVIVTKVLAYASRWSKLASILVYMSYCEEAKYTQANLLANL
jgi:hypothetical protein